MTVYIDYVFRDFVSGLQFAQQVYNKEYTVYLQSKNCSKKLAAFN